MFKDSPEKLLFGEDRLGIGLGEVSEANSEIFKDEPTADFNSVAYQTKVEGLDSSRHLEYPNRDNSLEEKLLKIESSDHDSEANLNADDIDRSMVTED